MLFHFLSFYAWEKYTVMQHASFSLEMCVAEHALQLALTLLSHPIFKFSQAVCVYVQMSRISPKL